MEEYIQALKSLSVKTRIRILALLHHLKKACVSEIVETLGENQYNISRHLKVLQDAGMVVSSKKGRWIYYQLNDEQIKFNNMLLDSVKEVSADILKDDLVKLQSNISKKIEEPYLNLKKDIPREIN